MTTVTDQPSKRRGPDGSRPHPPPGAPGDARCPHCSSLLARGITERWPKNPIRCRSCHRWVGRGRALLSGAAQPAEPPEWRDVPAAHIEPLPRAERRPLDIFAAPAAAEPPAPSRQAARAEPSAEAPTWSKPSARRRRVRHYARATERASGRRARPDITGGHYRQLAANGRTRRIAATRRRLSEESFAGEVALPNRYAPLVRRSQRSKPRRWRLGAESERLTPVGHVIRFVARVMCVAGLLLLVDATMTLAWKEPVTYWIATQKQGNTNRELQKLLAQTRETAKLNRENRELIGREAAYFNFKIPLGHPLGQIRIPRIGITFAIIQGDDESSLELGPGHYPTTPLPGALGNWTVGIAGHRTTFLAPFRNIDQVRPGDPIYITMPYARFIYTVEKTIIVLPTNPSVMRPVGYNRLALTACNPPFSAAQRIIVYARQTQMTPFVTIAPGRTAAQERNDFRRII